MSKSRKKIFPKKPVQFHSKLEKELGKWSNKNGFEASVLAIYTRPMPVVSNVTERQASQLEKLRINLAKRNDV